MGERSRHIVVPPQAPVVDLASPAGPATPGGRRRTAQLALLTQADQNGRLTFLQIQDAVRSYGLAADETPALLEDLVDAGLRLPPVLAALVPAPEANVRRDRSRTDRPTEQCQPDRRQRRRLTGTERLDISAISLADLGLGPSSPEPLATQATGPRPVTEPAPSTAPPPSPPPVAPIPAPPAPPPSSARPVLNEADEPTPQPYHDDDPAAAVMRQYVKAINKIDLLTAEQEVDLARRIEAGVLAQERLDRRGMLPARFRDELRQVSEDGRRAFDAFVVANLRLVVSIARNYLGHGMELLDLVQEGNLGLIHAVEKFDYTHGTKFSTYATWWIRQSITRALADKARTIRFPVHVVEALRRLQAAVDRRRDVGAPVRIVEVAAEADMSEDQARRLLAHPGTVSLEHLVDDLGADYVSTLLARFDRGGDPLWEPFDFDFDFDEIERALYACLDRERLVLRRRSGLAGQPATLDAIGDELGVTRERIRQIEDRARAKVRRALVGRAKPNDADSE